MFLIIAGILVSLASLVLTLVAYFFHHLGIPISFVLTFLALAFGAGGLAFKENETEKRKVIPRNQKIILTAIPAVIIAAGIWPYAQNWYTLHIGQILFQVWFLIVVSFLLWIPLRGGEYQE